MLPANSEQGFELFYKAAVTPWLEITANVQVIDGALRGADDAVVPGFRGRILF